MALKRSTSSLPEMAGDAALLVDSYHVEAIAYAMQRILSDPDLAAARPRSVYRPDFPHPDRRAIGSHPQPSD